MAFHRFLLFRLITFLTTRQSLELPVFRPAGTSPRYNHATQAKPQAGTLAAAGVTSPYKRPSFFFGIVPAAMSEQSRPSYEFGPFSVDAGKRLLLRNGEPVPLAPKVLETLLALIENRERVLTKDELLKQVWGDTSVEEGGLTRNVSILRKTLGEKPDDHQYIVTVPARGYRFVADGAGNRGKWRGVGRACAGESGKRLRTTSESFGASLVGAGRIGRARPGNHHVCSAPCPGHGASSAGHHIARRAATGKSIGRPDAGLLR